MQRGAQPRPQGRLPHRRDGPPCHRGRGPAGGEGGSGKPGSRTGPGAKLNARPQVGCWGGVVSGSGPRAHGAQPSSLPSVGFTQGPGAGPRVPPLPQLQPPRPHPPPLPLPRPGPAPPLHAAIDEGRRFWTPRGSVRKAPGPPSPKSGGAGRGGGGGGSPRRGVGLPPNRGASTDAACRTCCPPPTGPSP